MCELGLKECSLRLVSHAMLLRGNIVLNETMNAQYRRVVKARVETHQVTMAQLSAAAIRIQYRRRQPGQSNDGDGDDTDDNES